MRAIVAHIAALLSGVPVTLEYGWSAFGCEQSAAGRLEPCHQHFKPAAWARQIDRLSTDLLQCLQHSGIIHPQIKVQPSEQRQAMSAVLHLEGNEDGHFGCALHWRGRLRDDVLHHTVRACRQVEVLPRQPQLQRHPSKVKRSNVLGSHSQGLLRLSVVPGNAEGSLFSGHHLWIVPTCSAGEHTCRSGNVTCCKKNNFG